MYKILPILLFAFLLAKSQDKKDLYLQDDPKVLAFKMLLSDMNDTAYVPADYNSYIDYLKQVKENEINIKVNGLIGGNMFAVKTHFEIIDTAYCNEKSECIPDIFSNIIVEEFNITKIWSDIDNYSVIKLKGSECEYDYTEYGSESCDTAWGEYGIDCTTLEGTYVWDCAGCNCPGDKGRDSSEGSEDMPNCLLNCPGFANLSENSEIAEVCNWFDTSWVENECLKDCENDTEFQSEMMGELTEMCNCPSQTWDYDDNCIYATLSLDRPFHEKSNQNCSSCEYDFENYGSKCCDSAWDEYKINCVELAANYHWDCSGCNCPGDNGGTDGGTDDGDCDAGYLEDCSGDGDCCPESWMGDGFQDCSHQLYGCDLSCYNNDYGDCHFLKPKIENDYSKKGLSIELIYNEVVKKYPLSPIYNSVNSQIEYGIITGKLKVTVYHDKNVRLASYRSNVIDLIKSSHPSLPNCKDCISFTSVDMDSLRGVNEKVKSTISLKRDDIYDDSWAVIIGIDKYKYSDQLNYAVKDAKAVKDMLISKFDYPEENIRYLTDEEATLSNIKLNLGEVATSAGEDDRILVFYSGHGETSKGADGSETGYIVPYEGKMENLYATGLAMDDILRTCQLSKSKHMLFLMDACYSGLMTENVKSLSKPQEEGYLNKVANEKARQIITAGGKDEQVIERDEWQHSAFTKNLLAGLDDWESDTDNDGYVTADELGSYLRKSVTEDSDNMQTPQKGRFRNSGGGEFVFFSNHNTINQNVQEKSSDAKLDYLISEMEELKSQKSSDDKVVKKAVDGEKTFFEKYGYEFRGIAFMALEDAYNIALVESLSKNSLFFIGYSRFGHKSMKRLISIQDSVSVTSQMVVLSLNYMYYLTDKINPYITGIVGYMKTSWQDTNQNNDGDSNIIIPAVGCGLAINPFQLDYGNFPINVSVQVSLNLLYLPSSYEVDINGNAILNDWHNVVYPGMSIGITTAK